MTYPYCCGKQVLYEAKGIGEYDNIDKQADCSQALRYQTVDV